MKTLQQIFKESGKKVFFDNRNKFCKSLNYVLKSTDIKIIIVKEGFIKKTKSNFKYNVMIRLNNLISRYYI